MALGAHLHATWDMLAFVHNGLDPKSNKQALTVCVATYKKWALSLELSFNTRLITLDFFEMMI